MAEAGMFCPQCANRNPVDALACVNCGKPMPRRAAPLQPTASPMTAISPLQQEIILQKSKVKEPTLAAILGFVFPSLGAIYNGKWAIAVAFLFFEFVFDGFGLLTAGLAPLVYRGVAAYLSHNWAKEKNLEALERYTQGQLAG